MAARESAADRAQRLARAASGRESRSVEVPRRAGGAVRVKPVRITIDLAPDLHRQLKHWTARAAEEIALPQLPLAEVVRALIRRLDDDSTLSEAILEDLRESC